MTKQNYKNEPNSQTGEQYNKRIDQTNTIKERANMTKNIQTGRRQPLEKHMHH